MQRCYFADKVPSSQSYGVFSSHVQCENWTIKKAEHQIDAFQLWYWRRFRVPWTARGSSQSTLKEISPEYSLKGLMLKLKLQYFGHLMQRTDSLGKSWRWERLKDTTENEMVGWHHRLNGQEFEQAPGVGDGQGRLACCSLWGCQELDVTERLSWTLCVLSYLPGLNLDVAFF